MSMYESAERINKDLKNLFDSIPMNQFTAWQREEILNIVIRFGAVAKFRCRNNTAYRNFVEACFNDVASVDVVDVEGKDFTVLRAKIIEKE